MTGWLIFLGIILFIVGILMIPVHAEAYYKDDFSLKIKYLLFFKYQVFPAKEKPKKEEPKESKPKEEPAPKEEKKKPKRLFEEYVDMTIDFIKKYGPGAKIILKNIRVHQLELYWKVGAEDAAACGLKYGRICGWFSGALGFFRNLTRIEKTKIRIYPDFICEKDEIYGGMNIEFNPLIVLIGAAKIAVAFIKDMTKAQKNKHKMQTAKPRQNIKTKESA